MNGFYDFRIRKGVINITKNQNRLNNYQRGHNEKLIDLS